MIVRDYISKGHMVTNYQINYVIKREAKRASRLQNLSLPNHKDTRTHLLSIVAIRPPASRQTTACRCSLRTPFWWQNCTKRVAFVCTHTLEQIAVRLIAPPVFWVAVLDTCGTWITTLRHIGHLWFVLWGRKKRERGGGGVCEDGYSYTRHCTISRQNCFLATRWTRVLGDNIGRHLLCVHTLTRRKETPLRKHWTAPDAGCLKRLTGCVSLASLAPGRISTLSYKIQKLFSHVALHKIWCIKQCLSLASETSNQRVFKLQLDSCHSLNEVADSYVFTEPVQ